MKALAASTIIVLAIAVQAAPSHATSHKPTLAQIEAAKKAELAKKKIADEALKKLARAKGNLKQLSIIANQAQQKYMAAKADLLVATRELNSANEIYLTAVAEVSATHREIGKLAVHAYMTGGGLTDLESILSSSGPQELIDNLSTLENLGVGNKTSLKRFKAAEDIAQRAKAVAEVAKQKQAEVTARVAATKKEADDAKAEQQKEVCMLDGIAQLLALLSGINTDAQAMASLAIAELASGANGKNRKRAQDAIAKAGGIGPLLQLAESRYPLVVCESVNAIAMVARGNRANQEIIASMGGIKPLVELSQASRGEHVGGGTNPDFVQANACLALSCVCRNNEPNQSAVADLGKTAEACEAYGELTRAYPDVASGRLADRVTAGKTRAKCK